MRKNFLLLASVLLIAAMAVTLPVQAKPVLTPDPGPTPVPGKPVLPPPPPPQTKPVGIWQETTPGAYHQSGSQIRDNIGVSGNDFPYVWRSDPTRPNTYMWYGPNIDLQTSKLYQACWDLRSPVNNTVMTLDVAYNGGAVSNSRVWNIPASSNYNRYCLDFYTSPGQTSFEFRAMVHQGTAYIDDVRLNSYIN